MRPWLEVREGKLGVRAGVAKGIVLYLFWVKSGTSHKLEQLRNPRGLEEGTRLISYYTNRIGITSTYELNK